MDSQPPSDEVLIDIVDSEWRNDKLPSEDIHAPIESTLDSEGNENEGSNRDQENKWLDLPVMTRHTESDNTMNTSNS